MKITKQQLKHIIKEELAAAMLDAYIDNPTDMTMPEEAAFHPEMIKARTEFFRERAIDCKQEYDMKRGKADTANPIRNPDLTRDSWDQIDGAEEKQKELNRIISQLNTMMQDQDFQSLKQNPEFQKLNARVKQLTGELENSRGAERAAGRQISDITRNWVRTMMDQGPSMKCVGLFGLSHSDPDAAVPYAMEQWKTKYTKQQRVGSDYGRSYRDRQARDREEQRHQDRLRRMQRNKELYGMNENKTKMTKSQLKQIIKEELEIATLSMNGLAT